MGCCNVGGAYTRLLCLLLLGCLGRTNYLYPAKLGTCWCSSQDVYVDLDMLALPALSKATSNRPLCSTSHTCTFHLRPVCRKPCQGAGGASPAHWGRHGRHDDGGVQGGWPAAACQAIEASCYKGGRGQALWWLAACCKQGAWGCGVCVNAKRTCCCAGLDCRLSLMTFSLVVFSCGRAEIQACVNKKSIFSHA